MNANLTAVMGPMADLMEEHRARGRPSQAEVTERARGKEVRDGLCDALHTAGFGRPVRSASGRGAVVGSGRLKKGSCKVKIADINGLLLPQN